MPRYYDIDKLKEMVEAKADTLIEGKGAFLYVSKWLDLLPPADVAPKSEIALKVICEVEALVRKRADEAKEFRDSETRNPIVEERYNGEYLGALIVLKDIAELKNEYTEKELTK